MKLEIWRNGVGANYGKHKLFFTSLKKNGWELVYIYLYKKGCIPSAIYTQAKIRNHYSSTLKKTIQKCLYLNL